MSWVRILREAQIHSWLNIKLEVPSNSIWPSQTNDPFPKTCQDFVEGWISHLSGTDQHTRYRGLMGIPRPSTWQMGCASTRISYALACVWLDRGLHHGHIAVGHRNSGEATKQNISSTIPAIRMTSDQRGSIKYMILAVYMILCSTFLVRGWKFWWCLNCMSSTPCLPLQADPELPQKIQDVGHVVRFWESGL